MVRIGPPLIAAEREMLRAFLDYHRATLAMKCDGLDDEELRRRSMPPSTLTLLGLVRHMAEVERAWFGGSSTVKTFRCCGPRRRLPGGLTRQPLQPGRGVVHEYARHNGHADLVREGIDGIVGA